MLADEALRWDALQQLRKAVKKLMRRDIRHLIPEVGSQLVIALPSAQTLDDVAGIDGRIVRIKDGVKAVGGPAFGVSFHMGRCLLAIRCYEPAYTAAMNIRYSGAALASLHDLRLKGVFFSRAAEPHEQTEQEGKTLSWAIDHVMQWGQTPLLMGSDPIAWIADRGDFGKEAMIRLFATSLKRLVQIVLAL